MFFRFLAIVLFGIGLVVNITLSNVLLLLFWFI